MALPMQADTGLSHNVQPFVLFVSTMDDMLRRFACFSSCRGMACLMQTTGVFEVPR